MTDRGSAFHSWKGLSRFEALLEEYEINYFLAQEAAVNGKVEALNASFQKECVEQQELMDLTDAARGIGRWVEHYNHRRTHHGLGGLLVPADRFYGIAEQTLKRIEQGLGADTELAHPDSRGLELFRVVSRGGRPQVWLMGEKILG
jgi:transposase InsO family protein